MNPQLLDYYNQELLHLREMGGEFARAYPKIAARLGLESFECADPYVERLLEGFSFLAARVQYKLDAAFPQLSQQLLQLIYPHYLAPTPSMAVVQFEPDFEHPHLGAGVTVPRHTALHSQLGPFGDTRASFRSAHEITLWPLTLNEARYLRFSGLALDTPANPPGMPQAALRLVFQVADGRPASSLALDSLPLYLRGADSLPLRLYEHLLAHMTGGLARAANRAARWQSPLAPVRAMGFDDDQALLEPSRQAFRGYRLLQEYFAFAPRFLFVELVGLRRALGACDDSAFELLLFFDRHDPLLEQALDARNFALYATPVINLFARQADRIALSDEQFEYHVVPDRTRPLDFEVYQIEAVRGYRDSQGQAQTFEPFYRASDLDAAEPAQAYYQLRREARLQRDGLRSRYLGSEAFIALVDARQAPCPQKLQQLGLDLLCTNRDLPLAMPIANSHTDFTLDNELPVRALRCLAGPSAPRPMLADGKIAWRLLNHLSINYLSLAASDAEAGAAALRTLLALYCPPLDPIAAQQVAGLTSVAARTVTRRLPYPGPIAFGRGLELTLTFDDEAFAGGSAFLLAAVLQRFFAHGTVINSFSETVARTRTRGEIMRWPAWEGSSPMI